MFEFKTEKKVNTIVGKFRYVFRAEKTSWTFGVIYIISLLHYPHPTYQSRLQNIIRGIFKLSVLKK